VGACAQLLLQLVDAVAPVDKCTSCHHLLLSPHPLLIPDLKRRSSRGQELAASIFSQLLKHLNQILLDAAILGARLPGLRLLHIQVTEREVLKVEVLVE